ncbi:hypothetical protein [uncultured Desulfuromusa sp.]|uniref:hypothetical protein n=1 Tax=uncultured Desulfuromusa sp. TaxID=219183 RepID=UPI002AA858C6|nr:hypothetical protein [uncultured Desulfuromusa sp.]
MSNQLRKMNRLKDANLRRSWQVWLETVKQLSLGQRLTIAYQIVPGLRYSSRLCVMLAIVTVFLVWFLAGSLWPEINTALPLIGDIHE